MFTLMYAFLHIEHELMGIVALVKRNQTTLKVYGYILIVHSTIFAVVCFTTAWNTGVYWTSLVKSVILIMQTMLTWFNIFQFNKQNRRTTVCERNVPIKRQTLIENQSGRQQTNPLYDNTVPMTHIL